MKTLVVDANNILRRAYAAMVSSRSGLSVDGIPTGPTFVFINCIARHIKEERPSHVVVCWDGGKSTYRRALYGDYKSARLDKPADDESVPYLLTKEFLSLAGIHHVERSGVEADDLVAHYVREHRHLGKVVIVSSDHDFLQLLGPTVEQVKVSSANAPTDRWTALRVEQEKGCKPAQLRYVMALTGDVGDGVPGVRGIGPKKALKRLEAADWLWHRCLASFSPEDAAQADLALSLVDLHTPIPDLDLPLAPEFRPTQPTDLAFPDLLVWLERYQMASVKQRLYAGTLWGETDREVQRLPV